VKRVLAIILGGGAGTRLQALASAAALSKCWRPSRPSLGLGPEEALRRPFLASMGIYGFEWDMLFQLLSSHPAGIVKQATIISLPQSR
jgi:ADP-glucose pyrophosphorylase